MFILLLYVDATDMVSPCQQSHYQTENLVTFRAAKYYSMRINELLIKINQMGEMFSKFFLI